MVKPSKKKAKKLHKKLKENKKEEKKSEKKELTADSSQLRAEEQTQATELLEEYAPQVEHTNIEELMREPAEELEEEALEQVAGQFIPEAEESEDIAGSEYVQAEGEYSKKYSTTKQEDLLKYPEAGKEQKQYATDKQPVFKPMSIAPQRQDTSEPEVPHTLGSNASQGEQKYTTIKKKNSS